MSQKDMDKFFNEAGRIADRQNLLKKALEYCKLGLSVIPIKPRDKHPQPISWTPYQSRKAEAAKILQWWRKWPDSNVGIVTGRVSDLVVIDCDSREAMRMVLSLIRQGIVDKIPLVSTGKGFHLYFRHSHLNKSITIGNRGNLFKDPKRNVDVRGEGGYVVAPPSIHETGRRYAWASLNSLVDRPELTPELLVKITTNENGEEIDRKPPKKVKSEVEWTKTYPSRTVNKKTGEPGKDHVVRLMSSGHWNCTCDAFVKGHMECHRIKEAKEEYSSGKR